MIHFRDRHDIIEWAMGHLPKQYRSIIRSFEEGSVEFLGGFKMPPFRPGWIIKTTSKYKKIYYLFINQDTIGKPILLIMDRIEWQYWDGDKTDNPLYRGDFPDEYRRLKNEAAEKQ